MKLLIRFIITFLLTYVILSLLTMFSFGYTIDWVANASLFQMLKGYILEGLRFGYLTKLIISVIIGVLSTLYKMKRIKN